MVAITRLALAALFLGAGLAKLSGMPAMVRLFDQVGMGQWCRYAVGVAELLGGMLLLVRRLAAFGAIWLGGVMLGAIVIEIVVLAIPPVVPLTVLVLLALVAWERRAELPGVTTRVRAPLRRRPRDGPAGRTPAEARPSAELPSRRTSHHL